MIWPERHLAHRCTLCLGAYLGRRLQLKNAKPIKVHVGGSPRNDIESMKAFHNAVGDRFALRADANGAYTRSEAIEVLRKVQHCELEYFEQPLPKGDMDGLVRLRQWAETPIALD